MKVGNTKSAETLRFQFRQKEKDYENLKIENEKTKNKL